VLHVDHVVSLAAGGASTEDNLLTACEECNLGKSTRAVVLVDP
jgi:5-methylcytosine-specific restriction endonuclease McrA